MVVTDVKIIQRTKFLILNGSRYITKKGNEKIWHWVERPNLTSAVMVAALLEDKLVLIREFRVPLNSYVWELPAGLVEHGESPEECGAREVMEETGLQIVKPIRDPIYNTLSSPGLTNESVTLMFVEAQGVPTNINVEDSEDIEITLVDRSEARKILYSNQYIGSKAALVLLRFSEDGRI
jgi:ADP-ribose pyrophosphatase